MITFAFPRGARRGRTIFIAATALLIGACKDAAAPFVIPDVEAVDWSRIGSATVMFRRIGNVGTFQEYDVTYVLNGVTQSSGSITLNSAFAGGSISPDGELAALLVLTDDLFCFDVYAAELATGSFSRVSSHFCIEEGVPSWSPDTAIIYDVGTPGVHQIFKQRSTGAPIVMRFTTPAPGTVDFCPTRVPDVTLGPVSVNANDGVAYACPAAVQLVAAATADDSLEIVHVTNFVDRVFHPVWSPAGDELAFMEVRRDTVFPFRIRNTALRVMNMATRDVRDVAVVPGSGTELWQLGSAFSLCWLPNGRFLFNAVSTDNGDLARMKGALWIVDADGSNLARFTTEPEGYDHMVSCSR